METFETSKLILKKIVIDEIPFALALKTTFKKADVNPQLKSNITALIGCELRHQLIFDNLIDRYLGDVSFEDSIYLRFYLANRLFLKRFNDAELRQLVYQGIDKNNADELIDFVTSTQEIIPNDLDKSSPEFLSLRFNTPAWVIKMWQKQFGKPLVYKILKCNYHQSIPTLRVDTNKVSIAEFLKSHPDFTSSPVDDVLIFQGRGNPKSLDEFKESKIFFMKMATKYVIDQANIEPFKKVAIFSGVQNNIFLDIIARFKENTYVDVITSHAQCYFETKRIIGELNLNNVKTYHTEPQNIITCVSEKVDYFFCLPSSTCLDLLRSTPDYFLRVKNEKLDEIIAKEKLSLEESASLVASKGKLIYMVPTLSKKESTSLLGDFLASHPNFELIEEKQFFPFDSFDSCLYYAILLNKGEASD